MQGLCLGAPDPGGSGYPTIFCTSFANPGYPRNLNYSTDQGVTWHPLGPTGTQADLPTGQIDGISAMAGDWSVFKRLYVGVGTNNFAYYNP